jgi:hypothetical protein
MSPCLVIRPRADLALESLLRVNRLSFRTPPRVRIIVHFRAPDKHLRPGAGSFGLMKTILIALLFASLAIAEEDAAERAFVLALEWNEAGVSIKQKDRREAIVPDQAGMPVLSGYFYVLMDAEKNVHYSGALVDPRALHTHGDAPPTAVSRLIVPELEDARRLVIYERRSLDPEKGRHPVLEEDL